MIERDYILRMFKLLGQALARVLFFKEVKEYDAALAEVDKASQSLLGLNMDMIERMPVGGLKDVLGSDPSLLRSRLHVAGALLKEKGEILEFQGNEDECVRLYIKSLHLFMEEVPAREELEDERVVRTIDSAIDKLKDYELPIELKQRLPVYFENLGRYDKSEDVIFEIVEDNRGFLHDGISFYERLLLRSDAELEKGNLPRNEVEDGLAELQRKLTGNKEK